MTAKQIQNSGGLFNLGIDTSAQEVYEFYNNSGAVLNPGDLVVLDNSAASLYQLAAYSTTIFTTPPAPTGYPGYAITTGNNAGGAINGATLTVTSTTGFTTSGSILVGNSTGNWGVVNYTGITATTFTGCTFTAGNGVTGAATVTAQPIMQAIPAGNSLYGCSVTTSTTANDVRAIGVVLPYDRSPSKFWNSTYTTNLGNPVTNAPTSANAEGYIAGAVVPICVKGPARIRIGASTNSLNTVTAGSGTTVVGAGTGGPLTTSTTAGIATQPAVFAIATFQGSVGAFIAIPMENSTAADVNATIRAWINKH